MSMRDTNKFYLVDASQIKQISNDDIAYKNRSKLLATKEVQTIDSQMLKIINDMTLSTDAKVKRYNALLMEYQMATNRGPKLTPSSELSPMKPDVIKTETLYDPIAIISKPYKQKAEGLWSMLKRREDLKVASDGSFAIKGEPVPGANISDMVNKAVNPRALKRDIPGWDRFHELLTEINTPKSLLGAESQLSTVSPSSAPGNKSINAMIQSPPIHKRPSGRGWEQFDQPKNAKKTTRQTKK